MSKLIGQLLFWAALALPVGAGAASWTGVYYELSVADSQADGSVTLGPTWVSSTTGALVSTEQLLAGQASMSATAAPGVLKASIWGAASVAAQPGIGVSSRATSHAEAAFNDQVVFMPANGMLIGQTVTVNASFLLDGGMLGIYNVFDNNSPYFEVRADSYLTVSGTGIVPWATAREIQESDGIYGVIDIHEPAPAVIPVSFTTVLGSKHSIQYGLGLVGSASATFGFRECGGGYGPCGALASAEMTAAYGNSLLWAGISSVTDASGNPVDLASALGDSGFDYRQSTVVPLPAAGWLLGSGILALGGLARRRRAA